MIQITGAFLRLVHEWLVQEKIGHSQLQEEILRWKPEQTIPIKQACDLLVKAADECANPPAGLRMAKHVQWHNLGAFGRVLSNASTLEEMIYRYLAYEKIFYGKNLASIDRERNHIALSWRGDIPPRVLSQLSIGVFAILAGRLFPKNQAIIEVSFPQSANGETSQYEAFFNCPVIFDAPSTCICFNGKALSDTPHFSDKPNMRVSTTLTLKPVPAHEQETLDGIIKEVLVLLPEGKATVKNIANLMNMSPRTLQRRLSNYPDGLRGLIEDVRYDKAQSYLLDPSLNFSSVALLLGYSEQSAFNLAFRRWTDMAPSEWRAVHIEKYTR